MAASREVPWLQVTRGSPERLRTRRARACVNPEVGGGERAPRASSSCPTNRNTPSSHRPAPPPAPQPPAGCQLQRHLLTSAPGLWRNHWPWGRRGCLTFGHSDDSADNGNNYPVDSVDTRGQSKTVAEGSPLFLKCITSFPHKSPT